MGRKDAVQFTLEWAARARALGATVTFQPGWESRGNGTSADYEGGIVHHTASNTSSVKRNPTLGLLIGGRSDLPGPLCNVTGPWCEVNAPHLHVVAAHPANHAGASGGRSMGPLPVTGLFNKRVFGLEIDYAGSSAMTDGQRRAALIFARAVCDVLGRSTEYIRAHMESSITGKWDPGYAPGKTIDMAAFRRDAAAITAGGPVAGYDAADRNELIGRIDNYNYAVQQRLNMILDRAAPFKLFKLAGKPDHVATTAGAWVPMPAADPAAYANLVQARGFGTSITEVPQNEWDFFYQMAMAPGAGDVNTGGLVKRLEALMTSTDALRQGQEQIAAKQSELAPVLRELTNEQLAVIAKSLAPELASPLADEWDRRARDNDPSTGPTS